MNQAPPLFLAIVVGTLGIAELSVLGTSVSPVTATNAELAVFFVSLFAALTGVTGLLWHAVRHALSPRPLHRHSLWTSLRQAALLSLVIVLALLFSSLGILTLWDLMPLAVSALLIEFFFQAEKTSHIRPTSTTNESD
jgi:hypothetical protein